MKPFDLSFMLNLFPLLLKYLNVTLSIAILSMILGILISLIVELIRLYKVRILYPISKIYVSFFRGTPLLVQLFLLYYGIPQLFPAFRSLTAYNAAVTASLDKWDVTDAGWLATNAAETAGTITLAKIMNAKYIAMYAQGEAWSDYRRYQFAYPALVPPVNNATSGVQPSSYPYPTNEKVSNGTNVPTRGGITAKLWAFQ